MGCLRALFVDEDLATGRLTFDFSQSSGFDEKDVKVIWPQVHAWRHSGRLASVYLPALLFGDSSRSGLKPAEAAILVALTRETTRCLRSGKADREDNAQTLVGGEPMPVAGSAAVAPCPFLKEGASYVTFGGNGRRLKRRRFHGRGYRLLGKEGGGWIGRAGRRLPEDARGRWKAIRGFLTDLQAMAEPFGLIAAGWHDAQRRWFSLQEMIALTRSRPGRSIVGKCLLRVYTEADYLSRWRRYFARKLGFSFIPGDGDESTPVIRGGSGTTITTSADLQLWMRKVGLTDQQLATRLGVSRSWVSAVRSGRKRMSEDFRKRIGDVVASWVLPER
jgi:hypothetical protein